MHIIKAENLTRNFERVQIEEGLKGSFKSLFKRKKIKTTALNNISFEIEEGTIVGLIGSNGAGKSTLIKSMVGLIKPNFGEILVDGYNPHDKKKSFLKSIGIVLGQKNQLWWDLSPYETFLLHKEIYEISDEIFKEKLNELSEKLDVTKVLKSPVRNLSLGERMKCELIASLLHSPKILFLDEPTIGLDFIAQKNIRDFLKSYQKEKNATLIITSHYFPDIYELCSNLIILKNGKIVFDDKFEKIKFEIKEYKYMNINFSKKTNFEDLSKYGEIKKIDNFSVILKIKEDLIGSTVSDILKNYSILDYNLTEMTSQDLIEDIYALNLIEV
ncbi:MAG: ATP-binding cassette domain-containing protein [Defluviitaleaceae bacterium]|nr:ATP-binding cassette domain-containing protein [Defluviitaleaceae bacterium]